MSLKLGMVFIGFFVMLWVVLSRFLRVLACIWARKALSLRFSSAEGSSGDMIRISEASEPVSLRICLSSLRLLAFVAPPCSPSVSSQLSGSITPMPATT